MYARSSWAFTDPEVYSVLRSTTGERQWTALLNLLEPKLTLPADRALFDAVRAFYWPTTPARRAGVRHVAAQLIPQAKRMTSAGPMGRQMTDSSLPAQIV